MAEVLHIEVVWQEGAAVRLQRCALPAGSSVADALQACGVTAEAGRVGVFGRVVPLEKALQPGDRVEVYAPLLKDPKAARRERAKRAQHR